GVLIRSDSRSDNLTRATEVPNSAVSSDASAGQRLTRASGTSFASRAAAAVPTASWSAACWQVQPDGDRRLPCVVQPSQRLLVYPVVPTPVTHHAAGRRRGGLV